MPSVCDDSGSREDFLRCDFIGCYSCLFEGVPAEIKHWTDGGDTPLCPHCGLDLLLGFTQSVGRNVLIEGNKVRCPWLWSDES